MRFLIFLPALLLLVACGGDDPSAPAPPDPPPGETVAVATMVVVNAALIRAEQLSEGDEIVASGARFLTEGTPVRRMETRQP